MRVFVSEYLCSGALSGERLPPSLAAEGRAMWSAVISDFAAIEGVSVVTTRDERVATLGLPGVEEIVCHHSGNEAEYFRWQCSVADLVCVIAPEIEGVSLGRLQLATEAASKSTRLLNVLPALAALAADKFRVWECLANQNVATVPTRLLRRSASAKRGFPVVVKPRFGCGSQGIRICRSQDDLHQAIDPTESDSIFGQQIIQPLVVGRALSCAAFHDLNGRLVAISPPAEQRLSNDGRFAYRGGAIPAECSADVIHETVLRAIDALSEQSGQRPIGPVGMDLIETSTEELVIVDVNARFTTSYPGIRQLASRNLIAAMLGFDSAPIAWDTERVDFAPDERPSRSVNRLASL
jgi:predicted ATP-grasp superfamily ATP-dependent carboligase